MGEFLPWLPAVVVILGVVAIFIRLQEGSKRTDHILIDHEQRLRTVESVTTQLKTFDEFTRLLAKDPK